jgi:hypothetical protein
MNSSDPFLNAVGCKPSAPDSFQLLMYSDNLSDYNQLITGLLAYAYRIRYHTSLLYTISTNEKLIEY